MALCLRRGVGEESSVRLVVSRSRLLGESTDDASACQSSLAATGARWRVRGRIRYGRKNMVRLLLKSVRLLDLNVSRASDFYSPLPVLADLRKNVARWNKPSSLGGVCYDVAAMQSLFTRLHAAHAVEFASLPPYEELAQIGYGPGFTPIDGADAISHAPRFEAECYLEVGSGLSTYYCSLAACANKADGHPLSITCIEPYPYAKLYDTPGVEKIIKEEVQNVDVSLFEGLDAGDVLFIDSSHAVRIDGDVPFLMLEVLPRLRPGVIVHIHDMPLPYNVPYPAQYWVFDTGWPHYWNEAMLVQAFLAFNSAFRIRLSLPLVRHHNEQFLATMIADYSASAGNGECI